MNIRPMHQKASRRRALPAQLLAISLLIFFVPGSAIADEANAAESREEDTRTREQKQQDAIAGMDQAFTAALERRLAPGFAVALVGRDGAIWTKGYGYADLAAGREVTPDTPFMLASVSKTFIAAALMSEREQGRLRLDQDINELLPFTVDNPRVKGERIEVRHVASHTSGIVDHEATLEGSYAPGDPQIEMDEWVGSYLAKGGSRYRRRGNFKKRMPGEVYVYSNIGAAVGALIVEQTSGMSYRELLRQRFFEPLGMANTAFNMSEFPPNTVAVPHDREGELFVAREHYGYPTYADGQLRSSVNDLSRYLAMMIGDGTFDGKRLLSPESIETIEAKIHPDRGEGSDTAQALYWHLRFDDRVMGHSGGDYGVITFIFYDRRHGLGGVVLVNSSWDGVGELLGIALQSLTDASVPFRE
ncbi:hypothetical protein ABI59_13710 [Acidobacteria bacterium Mor1]|nr:hypothetical protein ABI59_13710 [Acidobacteria bacterium Mor1]